LRPPAGDIAAQRLAARLVPRFIGLFPDQVDAAAAALRRLYEQPHDPNARNKALDESTRRDALHGLHAVLQAAPAHGSPPGDRAVKRVLNMVFK
jgi:hypothetical protein